MFTHTSDGHIPYSVPAAGKPCQTYYRIFGDLSSGVTPVIALHGGPGATHTYILPVSDLTSLHGIPVVFYDQIGCGGSTRLPEKNGDADFWTVQLFLDEFHNLRKHLGIDKYDVFGHSWGSMLGMEIGIRQPEGLRRLILSSGPVSMVLWEKATRKLLTTMPQDIQDMINKHEAAGTFDSPEYAQANEVFNNHFVYRTQPWPEEIILTFKELAEEPAAYLTMQGPSEFTITGSLKTWDVTPHLHKIKVPTLLTNGGYDEAQDSVMAPAFREIPTIKWYTFSKSAHMAMFEEREKFAEVIGGFLTQ
ncbi:uncharacterized protein FIBRA_06266 [Fibroporia radiculosa]|uniref:AB hydrolase-1 domain-containing protein n=1 Tax=Fibroporia radiculosa TaxID=599839 RepID=J4IB62_9APHY|nr:uncharacterized protein FIBRA_06266 [Fibroporia radiculosa]CCM04106.1 predicted protein [Fibroporia radiculosa]